MDEKESRLIQAATELDERRQEQIKNQADVITRLLAQLTEYRKGFAELREIFNNTEIGTSFLPQEIINCLDAIDARVESTRTAPPKRPS
jgi:hypothetical protein